MHPHTHPLETCLAHEKVSIIVRSMDRPSLSSTLASIASQTHPNIEVLVIAACGSTHKPLPDHCNKHSTQLIIAAHPLHRSAAANVGLDAATGEFIIFLDDDDTMDAIHISRLASHLAQTTSQTIAVHTGVRVSGSQDPHPGFVTPFNRFAMLASNSIPIHAVLFKRIIIDNGVRFDSKFDRYEDWDFWLQASELGDIEYLSGISATYHQHTANSGTSDDRPFVSDDFKSIYAKWWPRLTPERRSQLMHHIWEMHQKLDALNTHTSETHTHLQEIKQKLTATQITLKTLESELHETEIHLATEKEQHLAIKNQLQTALTELHDHRAALHQAMNSRSWKLTAPLRTISAKNLVLKQMIVRLMHIAPHHGGWIKLGKKAIQYIQSNGLKNTLRRLHSTGHQAAKFTTQDYTNWIHLYDQPIPHNDIKSILKNIEHPLISVIMPTYNSNPKWLLTAVKSLQNQSYPHWELCIADDASSSPETLKTLSDLCSKDHRIHVHYRSANGHISATSNDALALAKGCYVALLDHDDVLHPDALLHVAHAIHQNPSAGLIYTDEDKVSTDGSVRYAPYFKPDWNRDLFLSHNMISHLGIYDTTLVRKIGGFRLGFEGSQDHDLALRVIEQLRDDQIIHIPKVLYHWRAHEESTASSGNAKSYAIEAGVKAIQEHLNRTKVQATASIDPNTGSHYRVRYELSEPAPLVSIVLPSRDAAHLIKNCVSTLMTDTDYPNFELIFVDNNTQDPDALHAIDELARDPRVKVIRDPRPFNYSALCNAGVRQAKGDYLALVNNDVEVISKDWLRELVSIAQQPGVGAVGARLWYPNDTLQHGGVILGFGGVANHAHLNLPKGAPGYFGRAMTIQSFSAVTGACLVIKKSIYKEVDGLDEINLPVAFNDIDFCMRIQAAGYRNIWTPYAELYHHESATRGADLSPEKRARFEKEVNYMQNRWKSALTSDRNYNPNLALSDEFFTLAFPPRSSPWTLSQ